jgi:hypothetical protein
MVSLAKLLRIRQGIGKKYKNMGLEKFRLSISIFQYNLHEMGNKKALWGGVKIPKDL